MQRDGLNAAKNVIKEALVENLDLNTLLASSTSAFTIADLGCSVGRNTLFAVETIIEIVQEKYDDDSSRIIGGGSKKLEFQVWFNDQTTNDFNTLFASLDGRKDKYFAAGVPGSFYGKLFPSSSVHVAYTSSSIHWLSGLPVELQDKESAAYNRGRIHYTGASVDDAVVEAYMKQFEEDMGAFLRARAEEMAGGGMVVIITPGVPDGGLVHDVGVALTFLGSILMDMVKEVIINSFFYEITKIALSH